MSDFPMYSGASADLGGGAKPLEIPTFGLEANHKAIQRGATVLDGAVQQFMRIQDSAPINFNEANARKSMANMDVELEQRLALAPGAKGALFDERGELRQDDFDVLVGKYTQKVDDYRPTYIMPESQMEADRLKADVIESMQLRAAGYVARGVTANARRAYEGNLRLAYEQGDYEGVKQINNRVADMGVISGSERDVANLRADKVRVEERKRADFEVIASECYKDPMSVIKSINMGELDGKYTPEEQEKLFQLAGQNGSQRDVILNDANRGRAGGVMAAASGEFSRDEVELEDDKAKRGVYDFHKALSLAREEAMAAPAMRDGTPEMEQWAETFYNNYASRGLSRESLKGLVNVVRNRFERKSLEWNPKAAADVLQSNNWFNSPGLWVNEFPTDSKGRAGRQVGADDVVYKTDGFDFPGYSGNKKEVLIELAKDEAKENRRRTDEEFDSWKLTEEGRGASFVKQQLKYIDIAGKVVGKRIPFDFEHGASISKKMEAAFAAEERAQGVKYDKWRGGVSQKGLAEDASRSVFSQNRYENVPIGIEKTNTSGVGIFIPKSMMPQEPVLSNEARVGMMACIEIGRRQYVRVPVVGSTEGEEALLTQDSAAAMRMRRGGRVLGSKVKIRTKNEEERRFYPDSEFVSDAAGQESFPPAAASEVSGGGELPDNGGERGVSMLEVNNK